MATQAAISGGTSVYWALLDDNGIPSGATGTVSNGGIAHFQRAKGYTSFEETIPAPTEVPTIGDNGVIGSFTQRATEPVTGTFATIVFDQTFSTAINDRDVYTLGGKSISMRSLNCGTDKLFGLIIHQQAEDQSSGNVGDQLWSTTFYWKAKGREIGRTISGTAIDAIETTYNLTLKEVDSVWWEEAPQTNYGVTYTFATDPIVGTYRLFVSHAKGDGTTDDFVLDKTPAAASANSVIVYVDGTLKTYTTHYTVDTATKTVTFTVGNVPTAGQDILVIYEYIENGC